MRRAERDDSSHFGIGAMIIFISSVMVAAIALATIINIAEKIKQAPEETSHDALRSSTDKIIILEMYIWDDFDNFGFIWELSAGSGSHQREDLYWIMQCTDENGDFWRFLGDFVRDIGMDNHNKEYPWTAGGLAVSTFSAGIIYESSIDQMNGFAGAPHNQPALHPPTQGDLCGPHHLFDHGLTTEMWFIVAGGGTTYISVEVHDDTVGSRIS